MVTYSGALEVIGNWSAILTFVGGVVAYGWYRSERGAKTNRLKKYLKEAGAEAKTLGKEGHFSVTHLVRHVGLTEDEILQASFRSKRIKRLVSVSEDSAFAQTLLFAYEKN